MFPLASDDASAAPANVWHVLVLGLTLMGSVVATGKGIVGWVAKHFEQNELAARAREERDAATIKEQRTAFLASLGDIGDRFAAQLAKQEAECRAEREHDREQHKNEIRLILKVAGLPAPGDTGKFRAPSESSGKEKEPS